MLHCALYQPEIPPNTGNIIRLCANANVQLHLIHPLGFELDDSKLRRAGLDYHEWVNVQQHDSFAALIDAFSNIDSVANRIFACSTKGKTYYTTPNYQPNDVFLFGPETRGLPASILESFPPEQVIKIPMQAGNRSLNLSNAAAIIIYEAWRQLGFNPFSYFGSAPEVML